MKRGNLVKVGSLVKIRSAVADPHLYGVGLVVRIEKQDQDPDYSARVYVKWSKMPDQEPKSCALWGLEVVNANR